MPARTKTLLEPIGFTAAVIAYLWILRFRAPWTLGILVAWMALSWYARRLTPASAGLGPGATLRALKEWKVWILTAALGALAVAGPRALSFALLSRGLVYFLWCAAQQVVYQSMICRALRSAFRPSPAAWLAGALFAAAHLPNPVLAPATFGWGVIACRLFERRPSAPALGLLQFLLSTILLYATPLAWHHNFRVGLSYFLLR